MEFMLSFTASNKNLISLLGAFYADIIREKRMLDGLIKRDRRRSNSLPSDNDNNNNNNNSSSSGITHVPGNTSDTSTNRTRRWNSNRNIGGDGDGDNEPRVATELPRSLKYFDKDTPHLANLSQDAISLDDLITTSIPVSKQEPSPPYTCTVYKMGNVRVKQEFVANGSFHRDKSWRKRYVKLWGTLLYFYSSKRDAKDSSRSPLRTLSMQRVEAGLAPEYNRKLRVLRLRVPGGEQLLLKLGTPKEMISWIEHLQAAANISMDIDHRKMPKFATMVRPNSSSNNNNRVGRTFNVDLGAHQRTVVSVCSSRIP